VSLAYNTYDDQGRLKTNAKAGASSLTTTYAYNIRSWTKSIVSPLFKQTLYYNESYGGSSKRYNGNIGAIDWTITGDKTRGYAFVYDNLSRLTAANYLENTVANANYKTAYTYDKHGNIQTLQRYGKTTTGSTFGLIDNLTISYTGNQLLKVDETISTITMSESADFKKYATAAAEYYYNANGAMTKDLNKGITDIQYNSLNLPRIVDIKSPVAEARNEYTYSAGGQKLKVVQRWNPNYSTAPLIGSSINTTLLTSTKTTDYVGRMIYENGSLKRILVEGGYIENNTYYFYLTDHLGNNRIVADASGVVVQRNHYYPFGMAYAETPTAEQGKQPYKYNGKELDAMHGLNLYDYSARQLDNAIPRFTSVDPMAEKYYSISPYAYCANNPMRFTDPTGMVIDSTYIEQWNNERQTILSQLNTLVSNNVDGVNDARIASLQGTLGTMRIAEKSSQLYQLGGIDGYLGGVVYNPKSRAVVINYGNTANFVHEVTHVGQFERGEIAFSSQDVSDSNKGGTLAGDVFDEIAAYKAQYNYDPSSVSGLPSTSTISNINDITSSWVQGLDGGTLYVPGGRANTGVSPLNINSTKYDFIKSLGIHGIPGFKNMIMGVPLRNYPGVHYKK
ncbi:MAG: RHS repeat-associated core domain-containing protein, partial [Dysgonomonas sp.]